MSREDAYRPIDCALHDRLESLATLGRTVRMSVDEPGRPPREIEDRLVDVFSSDGEEFVRTAGGDLIRLDRLVSVDGVSFREGEHAADADHDSTP